MQYEFLLFDADNTLFDFSQGEHNAFFSAMQDFGLPQKEEDYALYSSINNSLWKQYEKGEIAKDEIFARRFVRFRERTGYDFDPPALNEHYKKRLGEEAVLLPYAEELLRHLMKRGYRLFLVTNGGASVQKPRLERSTIKDCFEKIFISETVGYAKPSPLFFEAVANAIDGFEKRRALVIGDSETSDILGANRAGIDACYFSPKGTPLSPSLHAKFQIQTLQELETVLL